jgi:regulator of protease activity HflC (stomatin/prohibitin superfamily)
VNLLHVRWGSNFYIENFIRPTSRAVIRTVVANYTAEDLWSGTYDGWISLVKEELHNRFAQEGILLSDVLVRNIHFSDVYTQAIELRQVAEQNVQQAELEAEQARIEAQLEADRAIIQTQAQAERLRLIGEQIMAYPLLIFVIEPISLEDSSPSE